MTDFEHKSGRDSKQPLGSDPMLELTRLFGSRPRPVSARVSYGGESQNTSAFPSYGGVQDPSVFAQNSSEGSIEMSGQVNQAAQWQQGQQQGVAQEGQQAGGQESQEWVSPTQTEQWFEDGHSLPPHYEEDTSPNFIDSTDVHETQWTGSDWENSAANNASPPFGGEGAYDGSSDDNHGMMAPPSFVAPTMSAPVSSIAQPVSSAPPVQTQKPALQPSEISNISFGYGHSVQVKPRVFSPPPPPNLEMRRADPLGSDGASPSQTVPHQGGAQTDLNEALHDFDLTISNGRRHYRQPSPASQIRPQPVQPPPRAIDPAIATVPIGASHIETTDHFDLPPVPYEGQAGAGIADNSARPHVAPAVSPPPLPSAVSGDVAPPPPPLPRAEADPAIIYDWGAPKAAKSAKAGATASKGVSRGLKRFYGFVIIFLLFAIGVGGYFVFENYRSGGGGLITITADPEEVRVVPPQSEETPTTPPEAAIYEGSEANGGQGSLLDGRETPLNLDQLDEQPPLSNESSLEPRTVEDSILRALARAIPVHLVPTVIMNRDGEGNLVDVSQNNNTPEIVVRPGADYSAGIANARAMQSGEPPAVVAEDLPAQTTQVAAVDSVPNITDTPATPSDAVPRLDVEEARLPASSESEDDVAALDPASGGEATGAAALGAAASNSSVIPTTRGQIDVPPPATIPDKPQMPPSAPPVRVAENANTVAPAAPPAVSTPATRSSSPPPSLAPSSSPSPSSSPLPTGNRATAGEGDFYVQIASQPSQAAAQQSADEAKQRFASLIGGRQILIVPADIPGRGTYYRVRVATGERNAAVNLCEQYKQAGGSCFIGR